MSARGIVSGVLHRPPTQKTSANGNPYLLATIRDGSGDGARWWSAFVFNQDDIAQLANLQAGDPLAVAGEIDANIYTPKDGKPRVSFTVKVDGVLTARRPSPRSRNIKSTGRETAGRSWAAPEHLRDAPHDHGGAHG